MSKRSDVDAASRYRRETRLFCQRASESLVALKQKDFSSARAKPSDMPVGLSPVSISRFAAGILAALWAMAALANEYATLAAVGPSFALLAAIATNVFLLAGASLAFVNATGWRNVLLIALGCVTLDRLWAAAGSGAALVQVASALVAFFAIVSVTLLGARRSR